MSPMVSRPSGSPKIDALGILDIADELNEIERVDVDGIKRGALLDLLRFNERLSSRIFLMVSMVAMVLLSMVKP